MCCLWSKKPSTILKWEKYLKILISTIKLANLSAERWALEITVHWDQQEIKKNLQCTWQGISFAQSKVWDFQEIFLLEDLY